MKVQWQVTVATIVFCRVKREMGPVNFQVSRDPPHHVVSGGRGGWRAISRPQTEPHYDIVSIN